MIGIFDSGIGGLTVARAIMERLPGYDIVYFGDTARTPYGSKNPDTVIRYALEDAGFLREMGVEAVVVACNTASSVAMPQIREAMDVPVFEVITPAAELAARITRFGRIGVIGTRTTVQSGIYEEKIRALNPDARVWSEPCPLLVPLVEEGWINKPETRMIVKKYLIPLKARQIDTLVLGCTHYPVIKSIIKAKSGKRVRIVDSSAPVAETIHSFFMNHPEIDARMKKSNTIRCVVSSVTGQFKKTAGLILRQNILLEHAEI